jgi:regulator of nucleoside diphosphate kinase
VLLSSTRIVSAADRERLIPVVDRALHSWLTYAPYLDLFRRDLRRIRAVPPAEVPPDVITMNSRFVLEVPHDDGPVAYTLVYPEEESPQLGKVSVLSPMGTALLGARTGEEVCWIAPDGPVAGTVRRMLYQPEAAGDAR